jgi:hypothetical protein
VKDATSPGPVGAEQSKAATCDHPVWVTHLRGGEPLTINICQLCGDINWQQLREDLEVILMNGDISSISEDGEKTISFGKLQSPKKPPENAAQRLLVLKEGLRDRGWETSGEDAVDLALAALDERNADAKANAENSPTHYQIKDGQMIAQREPIVTREASGQDFKTDLQALINKHSLENGSDTPDYILASFLVNVLTDWNHAVRARGIHKGAKGA